MVEGLEEWGCKVMSTRMTPGKKKKKKRMTPEHNRLNNKELSLLKPAMEALNSRMADNCDPKIESRNQEVITDDDSTTATTAPLDTQKAR